MCFAFDASPPDLPADVAPIAGGAGAELLELESADGTRFSAALAESPEPRGRAVVILPDVRGLYPFYSELAERFAAAGHHAIAIDYFGRTAGLGPRGEDFEYMPHISRPPIPSRPCRHRGRRWRRCASGPAPRSFVTVGFCFGGGQSFVAATNSRPRPAGGDRLLRHAGTPAASVPAWRRRCPSRWPTSRGPARRCSACSAAPTSTPVRRTSRPFDPVLEVRRCRV